jgi:hypothetical protein
MAKRGRRTSARSIVERLKGTPAAKERLLVLLGNLGGSLPVSEGCRMLRIGPSRLQRLREIMIAAALRALEPRLPGRPKERISPDGRRIRELETELQELREELDLARIREELALLFPRLRTGQKKRRRAWLPPRHEAARSALPVA